ncbi:Trm112 family protein [Amycolatopsis sp. RTGN1]|uniref:Trm112 family protein n=1 Tax=Amycolatopsis ponsaeliensis TaxID=2992142 RepID=UPI00254D1DC8|nr:Trm112 family protein [Amycolatopsis sp. RTGN1]
MALDERLLSVLVCPIDKGALLYFVSDAILYNPRLRRLYRVESDIPLMRADQAQPVEADQHGRLVSRAPTEAVTTLDLPVAHLLASAG